MAASAGVAVHAPAQTPSSTPGCILKIQRPANTPTSSEMLTVSSPAASSETPLVLRPAPTSGPALRPTTATKPVSPIDSNTHNDGEGLRPNQRGCDERSQPQTRPPS